MAYPIGAAGGWTKRVFIVGSDTSAFEIPIVGDVNASYFLDIKLQAVDAGSATITLTFNGDTGAASYGYTQIYQGAASVSGLRDPDNDGIKIGIVGSTDPADFTVDIPNAKVDGSRRSIFSRCLYGANATILQLLSGGFWTNTVSPIITMEVTF